METIDVNLNQNILVKLTDKGIYHWMEDDQILEVKYRRSYNELKAKADENGYTSFHLWDFMRLFGSIVSMGSGSTDYFDINVKLETALR